MNNARNLQRIIQGSLTKIYQPISSIVPLLISSMTNSCFVKIISDQIHNIVNSSRIVCDQHGICCAILNISSNH